MEKGLEIAEQIVGLPISHLAILLSFAGIGLAMFAIFVVYSIAKGRH